MRMGADATALLCATAGALVLLLYARSKEGKKQKRKTLAATKGKTKGAGHAGNFALDGYFYKLEVENRFENELKMLQRLREGDPMSSCAPEFHGLEIIDGKRYLKMKSFFDGFDTSTLCEMDVKMGVRCFAESELTCTKPRNDLYERLLQMDPSKPTAAEHAAKAITKARWMTIRDATSSTSSLGFRVDSVERGGLSPVHRHALGDLWTVRTDAQVLEVLRLFLPDAQGGVDHRVAVVRSFLARLEQLERCIDTSSLFAECEVIGSSLLFIADAKGNTGMYMLDFGLTGPSPAGRLKHDVPWQQGNHEDGYMIGVRNLQRLWRKVLEDLQ